MVGQVRFSRCPRAAHYCLLCSLHAVPFSKSGITGCGPSCYIILMFTKVESKPAFPELEKTVLKRWQTRQTFEKSLERSKGHPEFVFYDGPPFPTGSPHYGTIFVSILKDVIPRYKTMRGFYVPRSWGWDCHGLPVETQAEKNLGIKDKREIEQTIGVAAFNNECRRIVSTFNTAWKVYIDRI